MARYGAPGQGPGPGQTPISAYEELTELIDSTRKGPDELMAYKSCLQVLQSNVQHLGSSWQVRPFGSSANGFGMKGSDLDVTIYLAGIGEQDRPFAIQELQNRFVPILEGHELFQLVEAIWSARVPILKFKFDGWLDVDVSCQNTEAILNTELLKSYAKINPLIRHLVVGVKIWSKAEGVCGATNKHLSSYTLTLMTIYFMQVTEQFPCIPTSEFSVDRPSPTFNFSNWTCNYSVPDLLARFFQFYAYEFQWGTEVVSVRLGYRAQMGSPELGMLFNTSSAWRLHVEDPFLLHRNLNCVLGSDQEAELRNSISSAAWDMSSHQLPQALRGQLALGALIGKSSQQPQQQPTSPMQQNQHVQHLREMPAQQWGTHREKRPGENGYYDRAQAAADAKAMQAPVRVRQKAPEKISKGGMQEGNLSALAPDPRNVPIPKLAVFSF